MPMPKRNVEGDYRYGYQGEFAEKEPELGGGINSFELRLWDSRIGRWTSPDPYGEFVSPYLGMGNNPISLVDPTGGSTDPDCCGGSGTESDPYQLEEVVIGGPNANSTWTTEGSQSVWSGSFASWHKEYPQYSSNPAKALDQWKRNDDGAYDKWAYAEDKRVWSEESAMKMGGIFLTYFWMAEDLAYVMPTSVAAGTLSQAVFRTTKSTVPVLAKGTTQQIVKKTVKDVIQKVQQNFRRFLKKIPANSKNSAQILQTENGYVFTAISPAANGNGYSAVYTKFVNNRGVTTRYYKTTIDPEGNIVNIKDKM